MRILIIILLITSSQAHAQVKYDAASIPETLKKDASIVKRYENNVLTVKAVDDATIDYHQVYTIMNEDGKRALLFQQYTNKHVKLNEAEVKVYDAAGNNLSRHKKKDMVTMAIGEGLIQDGFMVLHAAYTVTYPITVEYKYQVQLGGTFQIPDHLIGGAEEAVEQSNFTAIIPNEIGFRFKRSNVIVEPQVTSEGKNSVYKWSFRDLAALEKEAGAGNATVRSIKFAVNRFSIYGYTGDMSTWKNFGLWLNSLYRGLDELPAEKTTFFTQLVKDAKNEREKAQIIYEYMQRNFRYVSIQLGIGGFQPFSASFTDEKKYGDCKGLSNYMKAALKTIGIKSHLAIINSGHNDEPVDPKFPSNNSFNHVILCIPQPGDSIWLECTSSTADFNKLGSFTENRFALLVTENGGVLVPTPSSKASSNYSVSITVIKLNEDGTGNTETSMESGGSFREMMNSLLRAKHDDQREALVLGLHYRMADELELLKGPNEHVLLKMTLEKVPEFTAGSKMFLAARLYKLWPKKLPASEKRKNDFYFLQPFTQTDTTYYVLPDGYKVDALPTGKKSSCEFAEFTNEYWFDEQKKAVVSVARLQLKQHRIPANKYAEVKKVFDDVMVADGERIVIKKNE